MQAYSVERIVGEGSFGKALLCRRNADQRRVIIKQISIARMSSKDAQRTELEATLLSRLKHPNIVSFIDSFKTSTNLHIVMDFADGGDLEGHLKVRRGRLLAEKEVLHLFVQISLALKHIHDRKILHRDLKSQNIFLTKAGIVKLGDFGVSRVLERTVDLAATVVGTPYYMPPEICNHNKYNSKCDIWSLGVILFELMTLNLPFKGSSMQQLLRNILSQPIPSVSSSLYSTELRRILESMLNKNQLYRPGINAVLKSPVLQNRILDYLDENVKQQEFSHTVLHGAHILRGGKPASAPSPAPSPMLQQKHQQPSPAQVRANQAPTPPSRPVLQPQVGVPALQQQQQQQQQLQLERDRQLRANNVEDAKKLQRAAEERRERERERERAQAAAIQALRDAQKDKERERERDIERARERLAADKRAVELAKVRAAGKEKERERLNEKDKEQRAARAAAAEREKQKAAEDLARREKALREKAAEAERQLKARRERDVKQQREQKEASPPSIARGQADGRQSPIEQASAAAAALAAKRQANVLAFERAREEQTKLARARLKNQMAGRAVGTPSPSHSPNQVAPPKPTPPPKSAEKAESKEAVLVRGLRHPATGADSDSDSSEERDLRLLGPSPTKSPPKAKGLVLEKPVGLSALEGLGLGQEWLSELEERMGNLKFQVKQLQANSPKPSTPVPTGPKVAVVGKTPLRPSPGQSSAPGSNVGLAGRGQGVAAIKKPSLPVNAPHPRAAVAVALALADGNKKPLSAPVQPRSNLVAPSSKGGQVDGQGAELDALSEREREKELDAKEKEERRREREALREKRRLALKEFVQAQRDAKHSQDDFDEFLSPLPASAESQSDKAEVEFAVPSVFKFIITPPQPQPSSRPSSAKKQPVPVVTSCAAGSRPSSAARKVPVPISPRSLKQQSQPKSGGREERENSREALRLAMLNARKNNSVTRCDVAIEIFAPSHVMKMASSPRSVLSSPYASPRGASAPGVARKKTGFGPASPGKSPKYSQRELDIATAAKIDAQEYKFQSKPSIHDLDLEDDDHDDDDDETGAEDLAELCDNFDFHTDNAHQQLGPESALERFSSTLRKIYVDTTSSVTALSDQAAVGAASASAGEDAKSDGKSFADTASASADYHELMRHMQEVLHQPSKLLPSGGASGKIEVMLGVGVDNDEDDGEDDTFGEDEEAYILNGTPDKNRRTDVESDSETNQDLSPILKGTIDSSLSRLLENDALDSVFRDTLPDPDDPPPSYEFVIGSAARGAEADTMDEDGDDEADVDVAVLGDDDDREGDFPYDVNDLLPILPGTPGKNGNESEHAAYLFDFLTELFGAEKLELALQLLRTLSSSPGKTLVGDDEDNDEELCSKLESILGNDGLVHVDDLLFLCSYSAKN